MSGMALGDTCIYINPPKDVLCSNIYAVMSSKALQWLCLACIIWLQSVTGTNTNFPAYSSQLKQLLSISQVKLNNLAFASDAGKLFGFISGVAAQYLPLWLVLLIGSFVGFVGYGLQYLFITHQISSLSYVQVFLLTVLAGNSICWINTVCYITTIKNSPSYRQVAVGVTTSYQGLSTKIYTVLVGALFSSPDIKAKAYLLLNSVLPLLTCVITSPFVRHVDVRSDKGFLKVGFTLMFVITIGTGVYSVITSFASFSSGSSRWGNLIGISLFLLAPLIIPLADKTREVMLHKGETKIHHISSVEENNADDIERMELESIKEENETEQVHELIIAKEEIGVKLMLRRVDFWLYFFVYLSGATIGMVYLNNLGQIAESRGSRTSSLVSLSSSFGFFGRLLPSLTDYYFSRYMISRPASMAALMAPMAGAFFLLLNPANVSLYISTAVIGICTGAITSIAVSTTAELFGMKNFGVNHNIVVANIPVGSFVFGYAAALVYHKHAGGDGICMGTQCYRTTFIIWGSITFLGTFVALVLHYRLRKFYSQRS